MPDGQQFLTNTFDSNPYLTHDLVLAYGLLNWVTKGVFLGDYHVYTSQQVDDFFINDSEWIPSTPCLTNPLTKDRTPPDASNLPGFPGQYGRHGAACGMATGRSKTIRHYSRNLS